MISYEHGYTGYLGNRMFQAAATCALALHRGVPWSFPADEPNLHALFSLSAKVGSKFDPVTRVFRVPRIDYDPGFWNLTDGTRLCGYFQSEQYFAPYAEQIRKEFDLRRHLSGMTQDGRATLELHAVSVHVRRGDYLSFPEHHPPCTMDYYREAMARFPGARFLVCSDDPGWCLLNFRDAGYPVEISTGRTAIEDMALMASCDHHIIANSSFSWWAAWLGRNPDKRVIAPARWFGPAKAGWDTRDLIPAGWERA